MFFHTLIEKREVDLDALLDRLQEDSEIIEFMNRKIGDLEYSFIVESVSKNIHTIKEYTPMPIKGE